MNPIVRQNRAATPLPCVFSLIADDLAKVEALLNEQNAEAIPVVADMIHQGALTGGKRFRPVLLLLTARAVGEVRREHVVLATALEMIHAATLVHDDILDDASTRRHVATINARWGNHAAVLFGDYLFTHAFYLAATSGDAEACQIIGKATNRVCEGELQQGSLSGNYRVSIDTCLEVIEKKTAALCSCAMRLGARFAGASPPDCRRWEGAGRNLGLAFQIIDDVLDVSGDPKTCGKTLGTDLATGTPTLPFVLALAAETSVGREHWIEQLTLAEPDIGSVRDWLTASGAIESAWKMAEDLVAEALTVTGLTCAQMGAAFDELGNYILARKH